MDRFGLAFWILRMLPRFPEGITVRELVERRLQAGDSESTETLRKKIRRLLDELSLDFPLVNDSGNVRAGVAVKWSWSADAVSFEFPRMSVGVAASLRLSSEFVRSFLPASVLAQLEPTAGNAGAILEAVQKISDFRSKLRVLPSRSILLPPVVDVGVVSVVFEAVFREIPLQVTYKSRRHGENISATIYPLALLVRAPVIYVAVCFEGFGDVRLLALHRIEKASFAKDTEFAIPAQFDIDEWLAKGPVGMQTVQVNLVFLMESTTAYHLRETPLSPDQEMVPAGEHWMRVSARVGFNEELLWWILGFGDKVVVLEPEELRGRLAKIFTDAAQRYAQQGDVWSSSLYERL